MCVFCNKKTGILCVIFSTLFYDMRKNMLRFNEAKIHICFFFVGSFNILCFKLEDVSNERKLKIKIKIKVYSHFLGDIKNMF